ncbi:MAG: NADP-dependent phosphogluconate dehydrogenase, partial [Planctomycetia bacterium]|nr:NADP-dependent phosphogluconate dehydrogenase [Planctomycetia bacterium]
MAAKCAIGLIGLEVMGRNLALNMEDHGFPVAIFNRTVEKVDAFMAGVAGKKFVGCHSLEDFIAALERPRRIFLMVKAGQPVDDFIEKLLPYLEPGDIVIDGGNSYFKDTERRTKYIESKGLLFIGTGVSGGEEGARKGPSMMPGGSPDAWESVKPIFQSICARVGVDHDIPCCEWIGDRGAGHYVKMVHNGIEYGDMQLICEAYWLLKNVAGLSNAEIQKVFADWYEGDLNSYLVEITRNILTVADDQGRPGELVDYILDRAGAKGTGKWMSQDALDLGVPSTLVTEAVYARSLSA